MDTLEKAELTASVYHIVRFLKPGILIYNFKVLDTAGRKTRRRRRTRAIAKRFAFHANPNREKPYKNSFFLTSLQLTECQNDVEMK